MAYCLLRYEASRCVTTVRRQMGGISNKLADNKERLQALEGQEEVAQECHPRVLTAAKQVRAAFISHARISFPAESNSTDKPMILSTVLPSAASGGKQFSIIR